MAKDKTDKAAGQKAQGSSRGDSLKWWVLLTVIVGTFLGRLDQTVVNLALPKIIDEFSISVSAAAWIGTAYILANAVFVPVWGKLGDNIGRKKIYIMGFVVFIIGSVLAGLAWNLSSMLFFRVIQAIASSADYPTAMAIIAVTFKPGKERAQALGIWSSAFAAAAVFGPLIGGPLIDNFGWRSVFLINLPVGLVGLAMALLFIDESVSDNKTHKFDWWGAISLGIALSALVLVLDKGTDWGWTSPYAIYAYLTVLMAGAIFIYIDWTHPEPIVDFKFFKSSVFVGTIVNNFLVFMGMIGAIFVIPIFVQTYLGYDATHTGLIFMPFAAGMMIAAPIGGSLTGKIQPRYVIAISTFIAGVGLLLFTGLDPRSTAGDIILPILVLSFGLGLGMAQRTNAITSSVPENEVGIASSVLALARNIAGAFGIAIFATILTNVTESNVLSIARDTVVNVKTPAVFQQVVPLVILRAQISAYQTIFFIAAMVLFVAAALALFVNAKETGKKVEMMVE
jgi:EmrB/QacA subfamily drug resistance transporter